MSTYVLNAVTAPDSYSTPATISVAVEQFAKIIIDVLNQAIYWQLAKTSTEFGGSPGVWEENVEQFMSPGSRAILDEAMTGIRFRAATPLASLPAGSLQAVVTVRAIT